MPTFSHYPLQQSIYQTFTNDSTLMGLVVGVFDRPVQGTAFPYITLGESAGSDWSTKTTSGMQQVVSLRIWSREGGRAEAATIMQRIHTLLHQAPLTVTGQTLVSIRFIGSDITLGGDGWTYQGAMTFRALLQAN
jgi:hypothetical protein